MVCSATWPTMARLQQVNVMQLTGLPVDPKLRAEQFSKLPSASNVNNTDVGNSTTARLLNTAGYRFNQTDLNDRNQYVFRARLSRRRERHRFEGVYSYFKETDDRTDLDLISPDRPLVYTNSRSQAVRAGVALGGRLRTSRTSSAAARTSRLSSSSPIGTTRPASSTTPR